MPKTEKAKNCGLERKSDSKLQKTKEKKKERKRLEKTSCRMWRPSGGGVGSGLQPSLRRSPSGHLDDPCLWTAAPWPPPGCSPRLCISASLDCHSYCTPCLFSSAQEAGPASSLRLVLGTGQLFQPPGHWGILSREFSRSRPWKLRMSNNPSATRIRFHQHSNNSPYSLEASASPHPPPHLSLAISLALL